MTILEDVRDTLTALLIDHGDGDRTFQRMVSRYRDVMALLGQSSDYEQMVRSLLTSYIVGQNHRTCAIATSVQVEPPGVRCYCQSDDLCA